MTTESHVATTLQERMAPGIPLSEHAHIKVWAKNQREAVMYAQ